MGPQPEEEWIKKLKALGYTDSVKKTTVMQLLFRPSAKRKSLIEWMARKIVEALDLDPTTTDLKMIYSSFLFASEETITSFIEGTNTKSILEPIWKSLLKDLQVANSALDGSASECLTRNDFRNQANDDIVSRAEALLRERSAIVMAPPSEPSSENSVPITALVKEATDCSRKLKIDGALDQTHDLSSRGEKSIEKMSAVAREMEEFVENLSEMKQALAKLASHKFN